MTQPALRNCYCGSGIAYGKCCAPCHSGDSLPASPEALMRSRFCAYAAGGLGEYLIKSWHPDFLPAGTTSEDLSRPDRSLHALEIISVDTGAHSGTVRFRAYFRSKKKMMVMTEESHFVLHGERWLYTWGDVSQEQLNCLPDMPCPCGSGKKFKKCLGIRKI